MKSLIGLPELDAIVADKLDDTDLLHFCQIDRLAFSYRENFWRNRFQDLQQLNNVIPQGKSWKTLYLQIVYYQQLYPKSSSRKVYHAYKCGHTDAAEFFVATCRYGIDWRKCIGYAISDDRPDLAKAFAERGYYRPNFVVLQAGLNENWELADYFSSRNVVDWEWILMKAFGSQKFIEYILERIDNYRVNVALRCAARAGNKKMVDFFMERGADDFSGALLQAIVHGDSVLVDFLLERVKDCNWNRCLLDVFRNGHLHLVDRFLPLVEEINWNDHLAVVVWKQPHLIDYVMQQARDYSFDWSRMIRAAAEGGHLELVEKFNEKVKKHSLTVNWNSMLADATMNGKLPLVEWIIAQAGPEYVFNWNYLLTLAVDHGPKKLVVFYIARGANNLNEALSKAVRYERFRLVDYLLKTHPGLDVYPIYLEIQKAYSFTRMAEFLKQYL